MSAKRFLFVTPPGYGHVFPMIPLAWALRAAGHAVIVATCGVSLSASTRAGLSAVNVTPTADLNALFHRFRDDYRDAFYDPDQPPSPDGAPARDETLFTVL